MDTVTEAADIIFRIRTLGAPLPEETRGFHVSPFDNLREYLRYWYGNEWLKKFERIETELRNLQKEPKDPKKLDWVVSKNRLVKALRVAAQNSGDIQIDCALNKVANELEGG